MVFHLPAVRYAALVYRQGEENLALHLRFERPLDSAEQGIVLGELGAFVLIGGQTYQPDFQNDGVLLRPAPEQGLLEETAYRELLEHFGFRTLDPLTIEGSFLEPVDQENVFLIEGFQTGWVH